MIISESARRGIQEAQAAIFAQNLRIGWWTSGEDVDARVPEKLCLIHSEVSEAMEGHRKRLTDDKLPHRMMIEVELADAVIRILDLAGALGLNIGEAIAEKVEYNNTREDHKFEVRTREGGKRY